MKTLLRAVPVWPNQLGGGQVPLACDPSGQ